MMFRRVAPTARLTPISRVRSWTTMYMMFATPIPPTASVKPPITPMKMLNAKKNVPMNRSNIVVSQIQMASVSFGSNRCFLPRTSRTRSMVCSARWASCGWKMILLTYGTP